MKARKKLLDILISIITFGVMLFAFELILNLFPGFSFYYGYPTGLFQNAEAPLDFELMSGFSGKMVSGEYNVKVAVNSQGIRDYEHNMEKQEGKHRMLALGDSFTFGNGVSSENAYLFIMEKELNIEIIKAGVPGYGQDNQLAYFRTKGIQYSPDSVVIFYSPTDNDNNNDVNDRKVAYGVLIQKKSHDTMPKWKQFVYSKLYQVKTLRLAKKAMSGLTTLFDPNLNVETSEKELFRVDQNKNSKEWNETYRLFREFKSLIPDSTKMSIVYIPYKQQVYPNAYFDFFPENSDIDMPNRVLAEIAKDIGAEYIDVTSEMRDLEKQGLYFKYDGHFTPEGNSVFAELVEKELKQVLQQGKV